MVGELQVSIVATGEAALVTVDDLEEFPVQASLVWAEALDQIRDIENGSPPAGEAVD